MDDKSPFDAFKLCWDVILEESAKCEKRFFNAGHCKILDSRDTNFEIAENRLAYIYKYGYFNILFSEKCFLLFINECSKTQFPFENLKVCSLGNGPGFDIIGLLRALSIADKPLKCLPLFNAINVNESWSEIYRKLICRSYETCIAKSFAEYFHLNSYNINLIQGDVYSTLSSDSKNFLNNSNVLLMFNVFTSSKASPSIFESSLKEIFTLLQPGSLIFFIGSKNKIKLFSQFTSLKQFVKCVYGPQKVTLSSLPINEQISNVIGVKPCDSGHAHFAVWQKKNEIIKSIKDGPTSQEENIALEYKEDSDSISESSYSSFNEKNDESKNDLKLKSLDKLDFNPKEVQYEISQNKLQNLPLHYKVSVVENTKSILSDISQQASLKTDFYNAANSKLETAKNINHNLQSDFYNASNSKTETSKDINHSFTESMFLLRENKIFEETGINFKIDEEIATRNTIDEKLSPVNQITVNTPITSENIVNKKTRRRGKSQKKNEDQSLAGNTEKDNYEQNTTLQKSSFLNDSNVDPTKTKSEITAPAINIKHLNDSNNNVQSLLQRCESLISKLEEMTVDIKSEFNSRKRPVVYKTNFCNQQTESCEVFHHCCRPKIVHCCCCRKFCK